MERNLTAAGIACIDAGYTEYGGSVYEPAADQDPLASPPVELLGCRTTGGPLVTGVWQSREMRDTALVKPCVDWTWAGALASATEVFLSADQQESPIFFASDVAVGENWIAVASDDSIVDASDLAQALGGETVTVAALCGSLEEQVGPYIAAMQKAWDAELAESAADEAEAQAAADAAAQKAAEEEALLDPVKGLLAANASDTAPELLAQLAEVNEDYRVACTLAKNARLPAMSFDVLATRDFDAERYQDRAGNRIVRTCLAESPHTPTEVLERLANQGDKVVQAKARAALKQR